MYSHPMPTLDYHSPQTRTPRPFLHSAASLLVALFTAPLPLCVLVDMNRECIRTASHGEDSANRITFAVPSGLTVPPSVYFSVRYAVFAAPVASLLLIVVAFAAVRSPRLTFKLYTLYIIIQLALTAWLVITAIRFTIELNAITAQRDWVLSMSYGSSVAQPAILVALALILYPALLITLHLVKQKQPTHAGL